MKRILKLIVWSVLLVFVSGISIHAATWEFLGKTVDGSIYYYDKSSVKYLAGTVVRFWGKEIPSESAKKENMVEIGVKYFGHLDSKFLKYSSHKVLAEINCSKEQIRTLRYVVYDAKGNIIGSFNESSKWVSIVPESIVELAADKLCRHKGKK
jgi:Surface-adhesin protein E